MVNTASKTNYHFDPVYSVEFDDFRRQLDWIEKNRLSVVTVNSVGLTDGLHIALVFEGALKHAFEPIRQELESRDLTAIFSPEIDRIPIKNIDWGLYTDLIEHGHELVPLIDEESLINLSLNDLQVRMIQKKSWEDKLGATITNYSIRGRAFSDYSFLKNALELQHLICEQFGINDLESSPYLLKRWNLTRNMNIQEFKQNLNISSPRFRLRCMGSDFMNLLARIWGQYHVERLNYYMNKI